METDLIVGRESQESVSWRENCQTTLAEGLLEESTGSQLF